MGGEGGGAEKSQSFSFFIEHPCRKSVVSNVTCHAVRGRHCYISFNWVTRYPPGRRASSSESSLDILMLKSSLNSFNRTTRKLLVSSPPRQPGDQEAHGSRRPPLIMPLKVDDDPLAEMASILVHAPLAGREAWLLNIQVLSITEPDLAPSSIVRVWSSPKQEKTRR